jgi:hypothetical protein
MRYRLRTLLIVLAVGPMVIGGAFHAARIIADARERARQTTCENTLKVEYAVFLDQPSRCTQLGDEP